MFSEMVMEMQKWNIMVKGVSQNNNNDNRYKIRYRLRYTQNNIASSNNLDTSSWNYKMQTTGNYLFEIPNVNRDYNAMIYKTREVEIFLGFKTKIPWVTIIQKHHFMAIITTPKKYTKIMKHQQPKFHIIPFSKINFTVWFGGVYYSLGISQVWYSP